MVSLDAGRGGPTLVLPSEAFLMLLFARQPLMQAVSKPTGNLQGGHTTQCLMNNELLAFKTNNCLFLSGNNIFGSSFYHKREMSKRWMFGQRVLRDAKISNHFAEAALGYSHRNHR